MVMVMVVVVHFGWPSGASISTALSTILDIEGYGTEICGRASDRSSGSCNRSQRLVFLIVRQAGGQLRQRTTAATNRQVVADE